MLFAYERPLCARTGPSVRVRLWTQLRHAMLLVPGHENSSALQATAKQGVRANAVFPGGTLTRLHLDRQIFRTDSRRYRTNGRENVPARPMGGCAESRLSDSVARLRRSVLRNRFGTYGRRRPVGEVRQWPSYQR